MHGILVPKTEDTRDKAEHHHGKENAKHSNRGGNIRARDVPTGKKLPKSGKETLKNQHGITGHENTPLEKRNSIQNRTNKLNQDENDNNSKRAYNDNTKPHGEKGAERSKSISESHYNHLIMLSRKRIQDRKKER